MDQVQLAFIGGLGLPEVLVIGTIAILLFGTKKLPELGKGLALFSLIYVLTYLAEEAIWLARIARTKKGGGPRG